MLPTAVPPAEETSSRVPSPAVIVEPLAIRMSAFVLYIDDVETTMPAPRPLWMCELSNVTAMGVSRPEKTMPTLAALMVELFRISSSPAPIMTPTPEL